MFMLCAHVEQEAFGFVIWQQLSVCDRTIIPSPLLADARSSPNCLGPAITLRKPLGLVEILSSRICFAKLVDVTGSVRLRGHEICRFVSLSIYFMLCVCLPLHTIDFVVCDAMFTTGLGVILWSLYNNGWGLSFGRCTMMGGGYPSGWGLSFGKHRWDTWPHS